jgi:hypothetical protein
MKIQDGYTTIIGSLEMNPLDIIEPLWYTLYIVHDFIGNVIVTILATGFAVFVMWLVFRVLWGLVKLICKPFVLIAGAIAAVFLLA